METESYDDTQSRRFIDFLNIVIQPVFGTIWWVVDRLWHSGLPCFVPRAEGGEVAPRHPGIGLRRRPENGLLDPVPLLLGTSGKQGPLVFLGLSEGRGPDHPTSFGSIVHPAAFPAEEFLPLKRRRLGEGRHPILPSAGKAALDGEEQARLEQFLAARGLSSGE